MRNEKHTIKNMIVACLLAGLATSAHADTCRVVVNGVPVRFPGNTEPYFKNGTWVIPARAVLKAARIRFDYDAASKVLTVQQSRPWMRIKDGSRTMEFDNGRRQNLRTEAQVYDGEIHVPQEFLERALGANADWDNRNRAVIFRTRNNGNDDWGSGNWGGGGNDSPWYGGGGSDNSNWNPNTTAYLSLNRASDGSGTMYINRQSSTRIYRAQVILDNRGSAELRFWTDKSGQIRLKGRYNRRGANVTVDLWQDLPNHQDRVKGSVSIARDGMSFTAISVNGNYNQNPFNANFSAR